MNESIRKKHKTFVELMEKIKQAKGADGSLGSSIFDTKTKIKLISHLTTSLNLADEYSKERSKMINLAEQLDKIIESMDKIEELLAKESDILTPYLNQILEAKK